MAESKYYGIYAGIVTSIADPEKRGRIKLKIPEVLGGDVSSAWCEPCVNVAYDGGGDIALPPINEAVWVMFIAGDVNRPVWLGSWWSKDKTPFGTNYAPKKDERIVEWKGNRIVMFPDNMVIEATNMTIKATSNLVIKGANVHINPPPAN